MGRSDCEDGLKDHDLNMPTFFGYPGRVDTFSGPDGNKIFVISFVLILVMVLVLTWKNKK